MTQFEHFMLTFCFVIVLSVVVAVWLIIIENWIKKIKSFIKKRTEKKKIKISNNK